MKTNVLACLAVAALSILAYLAKIGMGERERFWSTLVESERHLAEVTHKIARLRALQRELSRF